MNASCWPEPILQFYTLQDPIQGLILATVEQSSQLVQPRNFPAPDLIS